MIRPAGYAALTILFAALWPALLIPDYPIIGWTLLILNLPLLILIWRTCSTPSCSYWMGLKIISGSMMSGCACRRHCPTSKCSPHRGTHLLSEYHRANT